MSFDAIDRRFRPCRVLLECLRCQATEGVEMESARTAYHFDGEQNGPDDPNRPLPLCRPCAAEHHQHWDDTWAAYHGGLL